MMKSHNVTPVMIFDGQPMPAKKGTNDDRGRARKQHIARAKGFVEEGRRADATQYFQRGISITPEMTHKLQLALRAANIEFIVAPYEADVQLAYMSHHSLIDCVVTEDSDLVCYGAKRILFKMDHLGQGQLCAHL
jgi:exonuclease-1